MVAVVNKLVSAIFPVLVREARTVDTRWIDARLPRMIDEEQARQARGMFRRA